MNKICLVVLLITLSTFYVECGKGYRSGGSRSRTSSRSKPTSRTPTNTYGSGNNYYGGSNSNSQARASNVRTTPKYSIRTQPTARYAPVTQPTARHYPQQITPKTVYTQSSGYHTPKPSYQQPVYPKQPYPQQNYPTYQQPIYKPSYTGNTYNSPGGHYSPGGYYNKKDHGVRNTVLAGLGGSALGMYLGYKLGGYTHSLNNPYGGYGGGYGGGNGGYGAGGGGPQYSVVHHYHHGDRPIIQNAIVESNAITQCNDVNICTPNTTPLCMSNGTIYCVTPVGQTSICNVNSTNLQCVNATITAPCLNDTHGNCNSTDLTTQSLEIPCVSSINVFGDFSTNKLSVQNADGTMGQNTLTNQGISNKYCVTVIAEPLVEPKDLSNAEYARYINENPAAKQEVDAKMEHIFNSIGSFMFF